ncbi:MAG: HepT-like ribonuclease domain-containing protein [Tessaracoccus sp.]
MRLSAAIEALQTGDPPLGERLFPGLWDDIWATRNHIAHGYAFIDASIIEETVKNDLPKFDHVLRGELARLRGE